MTSAGIDWQREKWQSGLGTKFIHQGEKNAAKYADEVIVLSKGVQDYITSLEFVENIFRLMNWNRECRYKVLGRVANSDQGLCMLFDLEEAIMFTPKPQEYTDPLTGEMKKKQMKFFPDAYKNRIGKSYNDYTLLTASYKKVQLNLNVVFQYNMPLRALAKMTSGAISMGMVDGIVLEAKGFWFIGLIKVILEAIKNIILNAQLESRLRNS